MAVNSSKALLLIAIVTGCAQTPTTQTSLTGKASAKGTSVNAAQIPPPPKLDYAKNIQVQNPQALSASCAEPKVDAAKELLEAAGACAKVKNWTRVDTLAMKLSEREPLAPWGPYFMSLAAENRNQLPKAIWMIELAIKKDKSIGILHYQKGRLLLKAGEEAQAQQAFVTAASLKTQVQELPVMFGLAAFMNQDCKTVMQNLGREDALKNLGNPGITVAVSECQAKTGDVDGAVALLEKVADKMRGQKSTPADNLTTIHLQLARIYETYKPATALAQNVYESLLKNPHMGADPAAKEWLQKKIMFLKKNAKVAVASQEGAQK
jgi:hypothetical protein